jgi:ribosomal protein L25 (general stress protein Ctc)
VETLSAQPRDTSGSLAAYRLRQAGRTPGVLFSLPGEEEMLLSFDSKAIATQVLRHGRTGWACRVFDVEVAPAGGGGGGGEPTRFRALVRRAAHPSHPPIFFRLPRGHKHCLQSTLAASARMRPAWNEWTPCCRARRAPAACAPPSRLALTTPCARPASLQGRQVHVTSTTDAVENVTLMHCPPARRVRVDVPLVVFGEEVCPGIKAGGRINWIRRTIPCLARGDAVPASFEVNIRCGGAGSGAGAGGRAALRAAPRAPMQPPPLSRHLGARACFAPDTPACLPPLVLVRCPPAASWA